MCAFFFVSTLHTCLFRVRAKRGHSCDLRYRYYAHAQRWCLSPDPVRPSPEGVSAHRDHLSTSPSSSQPAFNHSDPIVRESIASPAITSVPDDLPTGPSGEVARAPPGDANNSTTIDDMAELPLSLLALPLIPDLRLDSSGLQPDISDDLFDRLFGLDKPIATVVSEGAEAKQPMPGTLVSFIRWRILFLTILVHLLHLTYPSEYKPAISDGMFDRLFGSGVSIVTVDAASAQAEFPLPGIILFSAFSAMHYFYNFILNVCVVCLPQITNRPS